MERAAALLQAAGGAPLVEGRGAQTAVGPDPGAQARHLVAAQLDTSVAWQVSALFGCSVAFQSCRASARVTGAETALYQCVTYIPRGITTRICD